MIQTYSQYNQVSNWVFYTPGGMVLTGKVSHLTSVQLSRCVTHWKSDQRQKLRLQLRHHQGGYHEIPQCLWIIDIRQSINEEIRHTDYHGHQMLCFSSTDIFVFFLHKQWLLEWITGTLIDKRHRRLWPYFPTLLIAQCDQQTAQAFSLCHYTHLQWLETWD